MIKIETIKTEDVIQLLGLIIILVIRTDVNLAKISETLTKEKYDYTKMNLG